MEKTIQSCLCGYDDQTLCHLVVGERGSGKTTFLMWQLKWALDTIPSLKVLFVCPTFRYEATGKYNWLTQERYARRVTVFLKYKSSLCKTICARDLKKKGKSRLWFILEDCGSIRSQFLGCPHIYGATLQFCFIIFEVEKCSPRLYGLI